MVYVRAQIIQGIYPSESYKNSEDRVNTDKADTYYVEFPPRVLQYPTLGLRV